MVLDCFLAFFNRHRNLQHVTAIKKDCAFLTCSVQHSACKHAGISYLLKPDLGYSVFFEVIQVVLLLDFLSSFLISDLLTRYHTKKQNKSNQAEKERHLKGHLSVPQMVGSLKYVFLYVVQPNSKIPANGVPLGDLFGACFISLMVMNYLLIISLLFPNGIFFNECFLNFTLLNHVK